MQVFSPAIFRSLLFFREAYYKFWSNGGFDFSDDVCTFQRVPPVASAILHPWNFSHGTWIQRSPWNFGDSELGFTIMTSGSSRFPFQGSTTLIITMDSYREKHGWTKPTQNIGLTNPARGSLELRQLEEAIGAVNKLNFQIILPHWYGGFLKWWYPQIIHFNRVSIINHPFWSTPIFGNTHNMSACCLLVHSIGRAC